MVPEAVLSVEWHWQPSVATASTGPSDELRDMTRRFWLGLLLAFPVLVLEMGSHLFPALRNTVPPQYNTWLQLLLASPVVLWCGWPFFARAGMCRYVTAP